MIMGDSGVVNAMHSDGTITGLTASYSHEPGDWEGGRPGGGKNVGIV
jgi:hypothetical protein